MLKTNILNKHEVKWSKSPFCWMTLRSSDNHKTTAPLWIFNPWVSRYWLFAFLLVQEKGWYFSEIFSQYFFAKKTECIPSSVSNKWERIEVWCSIKFSQHLRISLWVILIFYFKFLLLFIYFILMKILKRLSNFAFYKTVGTEFGLTVPSMRKKYNIYLKYIWESDIKGLFFQRAPPPSPFKNVTPNYLIWSKGLYLLVFKTLFLCTNLPNLGL